MGNLWVLAIEALTDIVSFEERAGKSIEKYKCAFQKQLMKLSLMGLSTLMSLAFLIIGLFFIAVDYGHVPRGVVFICGGLLGFLVLRLLARSMK